MKTKLLLLALLLTVPSFAQSGCKADYVQTQNSMGAIVPVPSAIVRVCAYTDISQPCMALTIYSDPTMLATIPNPITTDAVGRYQYCAPTGNYNEQISGPSIVGVNVQPVTLGGGTSTGSGTTVHALVAPAHQFFVSFNSATGNFGAAPLVQGDVPKVSAAVLADSATSLASAPTKCIGQAATGVDASGNAQGCFTPAGGGTTSVTYGSFPQSPLHTIWVAVGGNDGTCAVNNASLPCATMSAAATLAVAGDVIRVKDGTYNLSRSSITKSGTLGNRIQFVSDNLNGAKFVASASSWAALVFTGSYIDVIGFDVTGTSTLDSGIEFNGSHNAAYFNKIHDITPTQPASGHTGGGGIHCYDSGTNTDCNAYYNTVENFGNLLTGCPGPPLGTCTGAQEDARWFYHGIYQETNGDVIGNLTVNTSGHGVQTYHAGASANVIEHNTVVNPWRSGILVSNSVANGNANSVVKFNVIAYANLFCLDISNATGATVDHNLGYGCSSGTLHDLGTATVSTNWLTTDPKFVSSPIVAFALGGNLLGDYHLQANSPAINAASASATVTDLDFVARPQGLSRDAGALEFTAQNGGVVGAALPTSAQTVAALAGQDVAVRSVAAVTIVPTTPIAIVNGGTGTSTPGIVAGTNITLSGTWPNQTVNATAGGTGTVTGVTATGPVVSSGGVAPVISMPAATDSVPGHLTAADHAAFAAKQAAISAGSTAGTYTAGNDARIGNALKIQGVTVDASAMTSGDYLNFDGTNVVHTAITKASVGLSAVDNTSDALKPPSTAQATINAAVGTNTAALAGKMANTAAAVATAVGGQTGCSTTGYAWNPATNTCTASGNATAASVQTAISTQTGCTTAGYVWSPQSNTCVSLSSGFIQIGCVGTSADQTAIVAADAAGVNIAITSGSCLFGSNTTLNATYWFFGGKLAPATGSTVTMNVQPQASPVQIFAGAGLMKLNNTTVAYPEWWATTGISSSYTDQTPFNAAVAALTSGTIQLTKANYYGQGFAINKSNINVTGNGFQSGTLVNTNSATANIMTLGGGAGGCGNGGISGNVLSNFALTRSVTATSGYGLGVVGICFVDVVDVASNGSYSNYYFLHADNGNIRRTTAWTGTNGYEMAGQSASLRIGNGAFAGNMTGKGFYLHNGGSQDFFCNDCETATSPYGIYVDESASAGGITNSDTHLVNTINDMCFVSCIYVTGYGGFRGSMEIAGGWQASSPTATGPVIDIESSNAVKISGGEIYGVVSGVTLHNASGVSVNNAMFYSTAAPAVIVNATSDYAISNNTITGQGSSSAYGPAIVVTSGTKGSITGNVTNGIPLSGNASFTYGITFDAASNNNIATPNIADSIYVGAPYLDAGTGNITSTLLAVASGTATMGTTSVASGTCASAVTVATSGVATTDTIKTGFNGDPTAITGYAPSTSGMLTVIPYPTAGNVNFKVCNNTGAAITPGALTLNWRVVR